MPECNYVMIMIYISPSRKPHKKHLRRYFHFTEFDTNLKENWKKENSQDLL